MLFPRLTDRDFDLFDDVFDAPMFKNEQMMRTDVKETDDHYELDMDLPGFKKEDIKIQLVDGNLTVSASRNHENDKKDGKGNIIHQERYFGSFSRSFFVGKDTKEEDIHAGFENGTLRMEVKKHDVKAVDDAKRYIAIE